MSEKARYSEPQEAVSIVWTDDKMLNVTICLNETIITVEDESEETGTRTEYEYDFNFFTTNTLTEEEIRAHPEEYLDYSQSFYQGENLEENFAKNTLENVPDGSVKGEHITADDIVGSNGRINLRDGTFDYGNGKLKWDGSILKLKGNVEAESGKIGGWSIEDGILQTVFNTGMEGYRIRLDPSNCGDVVITEEGSPERELGIRMLSEPVLLIESWPIKAGGSPAQATSRCRINWDGSMILGDGSLIFADDKLRIIAGNIGGWEISRDGLSFEEIVQGAVAQIPFDATSGTTQCKLSFKTGTYQLDESSGFPQAEGSTVLESVMRSYDDSGTGYSVDYGYRISNMGDFAFGALDAGTGEMLAGVEYDHTDGDGSQGRFTVNCGTIELLGYLRILQVLPQAASTDAIHVLAVRQSDGAVVRTQVESSSGGSVSDTWHEVDIKNMSASKFRPYTEGNHPRYRKDGDIVNVCGVITPKADIAGGTTSHLILTLPSGYRPAQNCNFVCQGSGMNRWTCTVATNGNVSFARYGTSSAVTCAKGDGQQTGSWLPFNITFMVN